MKKILIASLCSLLALTAVGCSNTNETQTLNNLDVQLDRVNTVVSGTSTTEVNSVSPIQLDYSQPSQIQSIRKTAYNNMMREEELRQEVLGTINYLKSSLNKKYKLGKSKNSALRSLTQNLDTHTTSLGYTKQSVRQNVAKIQRYTNAQNSDSNITRSAYNELDNLMQARAVYLENLQNTMNEICNILDSSVVTEENKTQNNLQNSKSFNSNNFDYNTQSKPNYERRNTIRRNIDTYNSQIKNNENEEENQNTQETSNVNNNYNEYPNNTYYPNYNNYYNNLYRNYRFNPNRNTDSFYPRVKNIDTYRFNPYGTNPYYNPNPYYNNYLFNQTNQAIPTTTPNNNDLNNQVNTQEIKQNKQTNEDNKSNLQAQTLNKENLSNINTKNNLNARDNNCENCNTDQCDNCNDCEKCNYDNKENCEKTNNEECKYCKDEGCESCNDYKNSKTLNDCEKCIIIEDGKIKPKTKD